ncbi:MAG: AAA family ATPase [Spirochaetes bacterium]|nr:AAA family ATPase [Spirochaetota bacterium]
MNKPRTNDPGFNEAEKILLGVILSGGIIPNDLSIAHFYNPDHKKIFETIKKVNEEIKPDIHNVSMALRKEGSGTLIPYITNLTSIHALPSQADWYANTVVGNSRELQIKELFLKCTEGKLNADETLKEVEKVNTYYKKPNQINKFYTGLEIINTVDSVNEWIVNSLIAIGLTVISGASKIGKSWLALGLWLAVQNGNIFLGKYETNKTGVLYLSLEDNNKRLKKRLSKTTQGNNELLQPGSFINTRFTGGVSELRSFLEQNPGIRLVIIDTLIKFAQIKDIGDYSQTTKALTDLKDIADDLNIAVVVIHHTKKGSSKTTGDDDPVEDTLGSTGINATADTIMILKKKLRTEAEAELYVTGRDTEDSSCILAFDRDLGSWTYKGDKAEIQTSDAKQEIYDYVKDHEGQTPKEIYEGMKREGAKRGYTGVKNLLSKMLNDESLINNAGRYYINQRHQTSEIPIFTGVQAEKSPENTEKQGNLDLQTEHDKNYNFEVTKNLLAFITDNKHGNNDIALLTQQVNGFDYEIIAGLNALKAGGHIYKTTDGYYKPVQLITEVTA